MTLFNFTITPDIQKRNDEFMAQPVGYNKAVLGGIFLAVSSITPAKTSFTVEQRSWLKKIDMGIKNSVTTTTKTNSDGTKSTITVTTSTAIDGTVTKETKEQVFAVVSQAQTETESVKIPLVDPNNLTLDGNVKALWATQAQQQITTTVTVPSGTETSYVSTETIINPEDPKNRCRTVVKNTNEQKPLDKPRPIRLTSITGKIYDQIIPPVPAQGTDTEYWNNEMFIVEETEDNATVRNNDGTETNTKTASFLDADGRLKTVVTVTTTDLEPEDDTNTKIEKTVKQPGETVVTTSIFDSNSSLVSSNIVTTKSYDTTTGAAPEKVTEIIETTTDELGKVIEKRTVATFNPLTEAETVVETETITNPGANRVTYSRNISRNLVTGVETLSETITETDGFGVENTRTRNSTTGISKIVTDIEKTTAVFDDDIIDDLVKGTVINEYIMRGDMMSINQVIAIREKADQHLAAWAFINLTKAKLGLGDRLSPEKRQQLYREMQKVFLGDIGEDVRGGPVLDRIGLYAWGESDIPVVFAPNDGFVANPIPGTIGLFTWSMRVQRIEAIERDKDNSFRQEVRGGAYGRSDGKHWIGGSLLNYDTQQRADALKDVSEGGGWVYN